MAATTTYTEFPPKLLKDCTKLVLTEHLHFTNTREESATNPASKESSCCESPQRLRWLHEELLYRNLFVGHGGWEGPTAIDDTDYVASSCILNQPIIALRENIYQIYTQKLVCHTDKERLSTIIDNYFCSSPDTSTLLPLKKSYPFYNLSLALTYRKVIASFNQVWNRLASLSPSDFLTLAGYKDIVESTMKSTATVVPPAVTASSRNVLVLALLRFLPPLPPPPKLERLISKPSKDESGGGSTGPTSRDPSRHESDLRSPLTQPRIGSCHHSAGTVALTLPLTAHVGCSIKANKEWTMGCFLMSEWKRLKLAYDYTSQSLVGLLSNPDPADARFEPGVSSTGHWGGWHKPSESESAEDQVSLRRTVQRLTAKVRWMAYCVNRLDKRGTLPIVWWAPGIENLQCFFNCISQAYTQGDSSGCRLKPFERDELHTRRSGYTADSRLADATDPPSRQRPSTNPSEIEKPSLSEKSTEDKIETEQHTDGDTKEHTDDDTEEHTEDETDEEEVSEDEAEDTVEEEQQEQEKAHPSPHTGLRQEWMVQQDVSSSPMNKTESRCPTGLEECIRNNIKYRKLKSILIDGLTIRGGEWDSTQKILLPSRVVFNAAPILEITNNPSCIQTYGPEHRKQGSKLCPGPATDTVSVPMVAVLPEWQHHSKPVLGVATVSLPSNQEETFWIRKGLIVFPNENYE